MVNRIKSNDDPKATGLARLALLATLVGIGGGALTADTAQAQGPAPAHDRTTSEITANSDPELISREALKIIALIELLGILLLSVTALMMALKLKWFQGGEASLDQYVKEALDREGNLRLEAERALTKALANNATLEARLTSEVQAAQAQGAQNATALEARLASRGSELGVLLHQREASLLGRLSWLEALLAAKTAELARQQAETRSAAGERYNAEAQRLSQATAAIQALLAHDQTITGHAAELRLSSEICHDAIRRANASNRRLLRLAEAILSGKQEMTTEAIRTAKSVLAEDVELQQHRATAVRDHEQRARTGNVAKAAAAAPTNAGITPSSARAQTAPSWPAEALPTAIPTPEAAVISEKIAPAAAPAMPPQPAANEDPSLAAGFPSEEVDLEGVEGGKGIAEADWAAAVPGTGDL